MSEAERTRRRGRIAAAAIGGMLAIAIAPAAGAQEAEAAAERSAPTTYHTTAHVRGDMGMRVIDYWSRGPDMLARTLVGGHPIVTIVKGGRYIVYDELTGKGLDIARSERALAADVGRERPFAFELEEVQAEGGEKIDELLFGSRKGEIWQITDERGRRKVWVTVGVPQVPLRVETFDRSTAATVDMDYQNWIFDLEFSDAFFALPPRIELQRFEFEAFLDAAAQGPAAAVPILYPDLLIGPPPS